MRACLGDERVVDRVLDLLEPSRHLYVRESSLFEAVCEIVAGIEGGGVFFAVGQELGIKESFFWGHEDQQIDTVLFQNAASPVEIFHLAVKFLSRFLRGRMPA